MSEQRSKEWHEVRLGRFTASDISNLLGVKGLGETGKTHAFNKAVEIVFGRNEEDDFVSFDMRRGIDLEPFAFRKFKELKYLGFIDVSEAYFYPYGDNAGASPDGNVGKDAVVEIKCPRPNKFFGLVAKGFEEIDSKYIDQMQMQMLCSNSIQCHFFNYLIFNGIEMWHEIIVPRDENRIELIKTRIQEATIIRDEYVKQLINNKQF